MPDLTVTPDPGRTGGGYAQLRLPPGVLKGGSVKISVYGMFRERFLGHNGWQPTPTFFGPYPLYFMDTGQMAVTIGPEIVDALDEFVSLRFDIGGYSAVVVWPDTVPPKPGPAGNGQVMMKEPVPPPAPMPVKTLAAPVEDVVVPEAGVAPETARSTWRWPLLLLLAAIIAAVAYFYWWSQPAVEVVTAPDPQPLAEPAAEPVAEEIPACSWQDALAAVDGPHAALEKLLQDQAAGRCTGTIDADFGLFMIQDAANAGSGEALMLFGDLYNDAVRDPLFEGRLGIVLADSPDLALDYYSRAKAAGIEEAEAAIIAVCRTITQATNPLVVDARREFCP